MVEPWFEPNTFAAWFGGLVGGGGGSLVGILGALAGTLAPRGIGRRWILGAMGAVFLLGLALLAVGLYALIAGQPYGIWYPLLLSGFIFSIVTGCVLPVVRGRYSQAEARKLEAEAIRHS